MRYCIREHQHKAKPYIDALRPAGFRPHARTYRAEFLLIDHEWVGLFSGNDYHWRREVVEADEAGIPIFVYPHSVRPNIPFDLTDDFYPNIKALFTIARGHKEILTRINYPHQIEVTGWPYTEIHPFRQKEPQDKIRVLFAPLHPVGKGYLPEIDRELNTKTYQLLLGLMDEISLTVRHNQSLEINGLWKDERVEYIAGNFDGSVSDMDRAHVVIAAFTYAHMAVALGHPLVMVGEGVLPHNSPRKTGKLLWARNWDKYRDYLAYPHNIEDCRTSKDIKKMLIKAIDGGQAVEDWKKRFIGEPLQENRFVKLIKGFLK